MTPGIILRPILQSLVSTVTSTAPQWTNPVLSHVVESQEKGGDTSVPTGLLLLWVRPPSMPGNKEKGREAFSTKKALRDSRASNLLNPAVTHLGLESGFLLLGLWRQRGWRHTETFKKA